MKSLISQIVICLIIFLSVQITARAAGVTDPTFGTNGTVTTDIGSNLQARKVKLQSDGKILALGTVGKGTMQDTVLVRYNPDGSLDTSFGSNGILIANLSPAAEAINDLALQNDHKIVIAGNIYSPVTKSIDFFIARYNPDGTLDNSFGTNGITTVNQSSLDNFNAVAVHPDGKIVAVGSTSQNSGEAAILRFNSNGTLDGSFGEGGLLFKNYPDMTREAFQTVALLPDAPPAGRILVGGQGAPSTTPNFILSFLSSLYYSNGSDCQDFGTQCIVFFGSGGITPNLDVEVLPDNKILTVSDGTRRFLSNGAIDTSFAGGNFGSELAVLPDGKFIIGGSIFSNFNSELYTNNGRFVGKAGNLSPSDIAVQPDGKIVFIGSTGTELVVTRLLAVSSQATRLADYDGDDKTDPAVLRPSASALYIFYSSGGSATYSSGEAGFEIRRVIPEKFDNLLFFPFIYWRTNGNIEPAQGFFCGTDGTTGQCSPWGLLGDIPVGGDYDGDTVTDFTVFRPSNGTWYSYLSSNKQTFSVRWGMDGDKPVPADYDYDGKTDLAVYRPSTGDWWILRSSDNSYFTIPFGVASDVPLTGDFDGDGRADFTVYRPDEGNWYQFLTTEGFRVVRFGLPTDIPVPGDYDGDGRHDVAVFREGLWFLLQSTGGLKVVQWGNSTDAPAAIRYDH
jgi:uncharacterized delta-60 repeat protein